MSSDLNDLINMQREMQDLANQGKIVPLPMSFSTMSMSSIDLPDGALQIRDKIKDFLGRSVADAGTPMDTGGGMGQADLWVIVNGIEYMVSVKAPRA